jgi:hypothetical protein
MESDPTGRSAKDPGAKLDAGKTKLRLLLQFNLALIEVAKVLEFGMNKYSEGGWKEVPDGIDRYTDAMIGHLLGGRTDPSPYASDFDPVNGMAIDVDSGLYHAAQVAWNALARLQLMLVEKAKLCQK